MERYAVEREKQIAFYERFLPRVDSALSLDEVISDNIDGVVNGNLLEFKYPVTDLNSHLFQCIKYCSAFRVKGRPVPAGIFIIDLSSATAWYYRSEAYLEAIEKLYSGAASKDNSGFIGGQAVKKLQYEINPLDAEILISLLKENEFTKIHIDENCIVGWATAFYQSVPSARKEDFIGDDKGAHKTIGEIRKPRVFSDYIHPYTGETNVRFNYLMDKLNDFLLKKNLGAFYTSSIYAKKSLELVRKAIARVPKGNDYIILDRCAGTGNLESALTADELSHTIVSTVEYYEYKVLQELIGSKVRHVIPPIETAETFNAGLVTGADALSKEYIDNPIIKQYIHDPTCTIILFENPPYAETTSAEHQRNHVAKKSSIWKTSYVVEHMKADVKGKVKGTVTNDMGNAFIWSGFKHYLRQPTDSYIVFSPVKYWKAQHLVKKQFLDGFAFNRRYFHTNIDACIMCALWANIDDNKTKELSLTGYDIINGELQKYPVSLPVKRIFSAYSAEYYDKRIFSDDIQSGILTEHDGTEATGKMEKSFKPVNNKNIISYLCVDTTGFDNPDLHSCLLIAGKYNGHGFYLRRDNYLEKLPMFAASRYITYNRGWTERARIMKSADGKDRFVRDVQNGKLSDFLMKCLLFTCTEMQNHMRTFMGSDERFYKNELCLDDTHGETLALRDLKSLHPNKQEKNIIAQWKMVLKYAKQAKEYNPNLTYGVYQIYAEIDTSYINNITGITEYNNQELHSALATLKTLVKEYYNAEIVPVLFEYEFLK